MPLREGSFTVVTGVREESCKGQYSALGREGYQNPESL